MGICQFGVSMIRTVNKYKHEAKKIEYLVCEVWAWAQHVPFTACDILATPCGKTKSSANKRFVHSSVRTRVWACSACINLTESCSSFSPNCSLNCCSFFATISCASFALSLLTFRGRRMLQMELATWNLRQLAILPELVQRDIEKQLNSCTYIASS